MNGSKAPPICLGPRPRWQLLLSAFGQFSLRLFSHYGKQRPAPLACRHVPVSLTTHPIACPPPSYCTWCNYCQCNTAKLPPKKKIALFFCAYTQTHALAHSRRQKSNHKSNTRPCQNAPKRRKSRNTALLTPSMRPKRIVSKPTGVTRRMTRPPVTRPWPKGGLAYLLVPV